MVQQKRHRFLPEPAGKNDLFDSLPDDLVISILSKLSSSAGCPSDFTNVLITYVIPLISCFDIWFPFSIFIFIGYENTNRFTVKLWLEIRKLVRN